WPRVAAMPGALEALAALQGRYRLVVATNAAASGRALVRQALERVGLLRYVAQVFTPQELAARKPDVRFFQAIVEALGCAPAEAVMVGDGYDSDVQGAKAASLWAVWYNPRGRRPPALPPAHDAEVADLRALPAALAALEAALAEGSPPARE
ncbi:MAG: HAD family hydrolase, partial [Chloroflexi bacterium]|nr:HAD family hydrolase [Chloroflexota bacterium]